MNASQTFKAFFQKVKATPHWKVMEDTVENSPWHREANVAVHTTMTIDHYLNKFYDERNDRQRLITLIALLFHDFGKPEAEETLEKKDGSGELYRRYAGHEPVSANEFMSFICDQPELRNDLFVAGLSWIDLRMIKVMIEHHLPYGLKNETKRQNLKQMVLTTFGEDDVCFYDMLYSDSAGRISDDHPEKLANVDRWIKDFQWLQVKPKAARDPDPPELFVLVGVSGAGKSTFVRTHASGVAVFSEDDLRMEYAEQHLDMVDFEHWPTMTPQEQYDAAWKFCHMNPESKFDAFSKAKFNEALDRGQTLIVDRMNQGRKGRGKYIQAAKDKGYFIRSIEFPISESTAKARQQTRADKRVPDYRVHQIVMQLETPWYGPEVDAFEIIPPT